MCVFFFTLPLAHSRAESATRPVGQCANSSAINCLVASREAYDDGSDQLLEPILHDLDLNVHEVGRTSVCWTTHRSCWIQQVMRAPIF